MPTSLDSILTLDPPSTSTSSPSSTEPHPVPYYATWGDLVDDYYRMTPLLPEDSSDLLLPALQESRLSHAVRIQVLQDSQIALDLLFEDVETDNRMSKEVSKPLYSPRGCLAPPPDYVAFSPEGYINEPLIYFLPQDLMPAYHCLPRPPSYASVLPQ